MGGKNEEIYILKCDSQNYICRLRSLNDKIIKKKVNN